jgi:hypothetical protein
MNEPVKITGSRLLLPSGLSNVQSPPKSAGPISYDLDAANVQRKDATTIAVPLWRAGRTEMIQMFACLFLDVPSAKALAEALLEVTAQPRSAR